MQTGDKVTFPNRMPEPWFLGTYPENLTGIVQKVFKNGQVAIAVDQLRNNSEDGRRTLHFKAAFINGEIDMPSQRHPSY